MNLTRVFQPADATELAFVRTLLDGAGIPFSVENENYFVAGGGYLSHGDTEVWIQVAESDVERARAVLKERFES
jgi:uncharacterized protein YaaQ